VTIGIPVVTVDPWACPGRADPDLRLDLAARLSEQHAGDLEAGEAEDAANSAYVFGLGCTAVYLEYLLREPTAASVLASAAACATEGDPARHEPGSGFYGPGECGGA
jgi:hypothetical protein